MKLTELEANFQDLLSKLAGIAFTGEKPSYPEIDWSLPKYTVSVDTTNAANASVEGSWPKQVTQGEAAVITVAPNTGYQLLSVSYKIGASGESQTASISDGKAVITIEHVTENITVYITASAESAHSVNVVVKRITGVTAAPVSNYQSVTPNLQTTDDATTGTTVSGGSMVSDNDSFSGIVSMGSGYGLYKMVVKMGGTDITDTEGVVNPITKAINIESVTGDVVIELYVKAVTADGVFDGVTYNVFRAYTTSWPRPGGDLVTTPDWCCMADAVAVPAGAKRIKWCFGGACGAKLGTGSTREPQLNKCVVAFDSTYNSITQGITRIGSGFTGEETERIFDISSSDPSAWANIRASFVAAGINSSAGLYYSTETSGDNWQTLWRSPNFVEPSNE